MLQDVDLSLVSWLESALPSGTGIRFDRPAPDWDSEPGPAFLSLFLHDIRRSSREPAQSGWSEVRETDGRLVGRQPASRVYRISYLATAWAGAIQDPSLRTLAEHGLLGELIEACSATESIAQDCLTGSLSAYGLPIPVRCADDDPGRPTDGVWAGLGIAMRTHVVLELTVPVVPPMVTDLAPTAREITLGTGRLPTLSGEVAAGTTRRTRRTTVTELPSRTDS